MGRRYLLLEDIRENVINKMKRFNRGKNDSRTDCGGSSHRWKQATMRLNPTNHTVHSEEMGLMVNECSLSPTHDLHSQSSNLILMGGKGVNWWPKPIWSIPVSPVFPGCHRYYSPQSCKCNRWGNENKRTCRMLKTRPLWPTFVNLKDVQSRNGRSYSPHTG